MLSPIRRLWHMSASYCTGGESPGALSCGLSAEERTSRTSENFLLAKFAEHPFHDVGEEGKKRNYGSRGSSGSSGKGGVVTIASFVLSTIAITSSCSGWGTSNLSSVR